MSIPRYLMLLAVLALIGACTAAQPTPSPVSIPSSAPSADATATTGPTAAPLQTSRPTDTPMPTVPPTQSPTAEPTATAAPSPTPTEATPSPTAMPPTGAWQLERISRQAFDRVAIAIDDVGALHVAGSGRRGIVYLTNAGGEWTSVSLGVPSGTERYDRIASLAIDYLGRIAVAIERRDCPVPGCMATAGEVYAAVVDPSGGWSTMMRVGEGLEPSILLHEGDVHLAYVGGAYSDDVCSEKRPVRYATNEQGTWVDVRATRDGHDGLIALERDGDPVVIAGNLCETLGPEGAFLVRPTGEPLGRLDPVPGTTPDDELVNVAVDLVDHVHLLYRRDGANHYVRRDDVEWTQPIELPDGTAGAIGTAGDGVAHIVGFDGTRVWHASNTTGTFVADLISPAPASDHYLFRAAVNVADRPHVVFVMPDADGNPDELWHAVMVPD